MLKIPLNEKKKLLKVVIKVLKTKCTFQGKYEQDGLQESGLGLCPFDPKQNNTAVYSGE